MYSRSRALPLPFVVLAVMIGGAVGTKTADNAHLGVGESGRGDRTIDAAYPKSADEMVLVQGATAHVDGLPFREAVGDAEYRLSQVPYVYDIESPYDPTNKGQISADGHSALIRFKIAGDQSEAGGSLACPSLADDQRRAARVGGGRSVYPVQSPAAQHLQA